MVELPGTPLDVAGVGFGPSNLALAVALHEHNRRPAPGAGGAPVGGLRAMFFERRPRFGWHPGMLIDSSTVQVSFLKDLVTMRNPASDFSFVAYLHGAGRLADFVNCRTMFPLRVEFNDYFAWAADRLAECVTYGGEVTEIRPWVTDGVVVAFDVIVGRPTKQVEVHRAANVIVAAGLVPRLPPGVSTSTRVWHNQDLLPRLADLDGEVVPRRFVVVGAGQSAAETTEYLSRRYPAAEVCAVFSRFGYAPADDSGFANRIFDPDAVDVFYGAPESVKQMLAAYHRTTNYSVVDPELIEELYRRTYKERVLGREHLRVFNACRVADVHESTAGVSVVVEFLPSGERTRLDADVVVYATGYEPADPLRVLGRVGPWCRRDGSGRLAIGRDYRLDLAVPATAGLYLTGASEYAHGFSATLLSNIAVRAGEVLASIRADHPAEAPVGDRRRLVPLGPAREAP